MSIPAIFFFRYSYKKALFRYRRDVFQHAVGYILGHGYLAHNW